MNFRLSSSLLIIDHHHTVPRCFKRYFNENNSKNKVFIGFEHDMNVTEGMNIMMIISYKELMDAYKVSADQLPHGLNKNF